MQSLEWTTEIIIAASVAGLVFAVLGYLLAMVWMGRKNTELSGQLKQTEQALELANTQSQKQQEDIKQLTEALHEKELSESKLQTRLDSVQSTAQATEQRLNDTVTELKGQLASQQSALDEVKGQHHSVEKQLETAQADNRALKEQTQDLRNRLEKAEQNIQQERSLVSQLKEELAQEGKKAKELESSNFEAREQLKEAKQNLVEVQQRHTQLQESYQSLSNEHTELKTTLKRKEEHFKEQMQQLSETKQSLTKEFENLANKIFEEKGKTFTHTSQASIDTMLKPFREQIEGFQKRVNEVHDASLQNSTNLNAEIKKVLDVGLKMQDEANNLVTALKGDKKAQGTWSEVQAEILLEMSGLHKGREYERESSHKTDEGNLQRPDFIVRMPNDKHIIIDSKISLNAYVQSVSAKTEEERDLYLKAHVDAIRKHVTDLSAKNYPKLKSLNTPEFVFMFMGNEPAYLAALDADPGLAQSAYHKGIAIVTPNTLLSSLRIVSHLWSIDKQNANTRELAEHASKVYDKLRVFVGKMEKLGNQIGTVSKSYGDAWKTLKDGNGALTKQVAKFVEMGVSVKEKLPAEMTEDDGIELLALDDADKSIDGADELSAINSDQEKVENN